MRLTDLRFRTFPDSRCRAVVSLEWSEDRTFEGEVEGTDTHQGRLQAGALSTLRAAQSATQERLALELRGIKAVRAFDSWVVIVSLQGRSGERDYTLLGSTAVTAEELVRGAVLAVLDATNRILERYIDPADA